MRQEHPSRIQSSTRAKYSLLPGVVRFTAASTLLTTIIAGCCSSKATISDLQYCDDKVGIEHYRNYETRVAYPCIDTQTPASVATSEQPRNIISRANDETQEVTLQDVVTLALSHNDVIETSALGGVGSKAVLTNPDAAATAYDPAIQRSGVLFGRGRGVEAALSDFDTTFATSMVWGRSDASFSNVLPTASETGTFRSSLSKQFAHGGSIQLSNDWNYLGTSNAPVNGFQSAFYGSLGASYRQPLLAGSGTDYTRIAGPTNPNFGAITGVGQGVLIARISSDISIADFEIAVRNALRDIENAYWDLYLAYRIYDTAAVAHQSAFQTWRESQDRLEVGILKPADELQARDRLYETKANVENTLSDLFAAEVELRRLIGLPMNDGTVLRPTDEPILAEVVPDWRVCITDGLTHRVELRRQKWNIKSAQLQLKAAKSLVRPRLDFVGSYDFNGYGDRLASQSNAPYRSAVGSLSQQDDQSWTAGLELSMPIGFRQARSQVRNLELQLTKSMAVLASQEKNVAHDIAISIQDVTASYSAAQSNFKRLRAASRRVELLEAERDVGTLTLDLVLRAQAGLANAESSYYQQLVRYAKALTNLQFATGKLLPHNGVGLAEGPWCPEAYSDAALKAYAETHAKDAPHLASQPCEFASDGPTGTVELAPVFSSDVVPPGVPAAEQEYDQDPKELTPAASDEEIPMVEPPPVAPAEDVPASAKPEQMSRADSTSILDRLVPERLRISRAPAVESAKADDENQNL